VKTASVIETAHLKLLPHAPAHLIALLESARSYEDASGMSVADELHDFLAGASPEYRAHLLAAPSPDPWKFGFAVMHSAEKIVIGMCGFKGPPGTDNTVEIAYGIATKYQCRGYATEAAMALVGYAFEQGVHTVVAHTLPERNASTSVLRKSGFTCIGEVIDPEDGRVWRWETTPAMVLARLSDAARGGSG